jgi:hypothetical protein
MAVCDIAPSCHVILHISCFSRARDAIRRMHMLTTCHSTSTEQQLDTRGNERCVIAQKQAPRTVTHHGPVNTHKPPVDALLKPVLKAGQLP